MCTKFKPKAGDCVDIRAAARKVILNKGGVARSADYVAAGIRAVNAVNLCSASFLDRVHHDYFQMAEQSDATEEPLLATLIPEGVACMLIAVWMLCHTNLFSSSSKTLSVLCEKTFVP